MADIECQRVVVSVAVLQVEQVLLKWTILRFELKCHFKLPHVFSTLHLLKSLKRNYISNRNF